MGLVFIIIFIAIAFVDYEAIQMGTSLMNASSDGAWLTGVVTIVGAVYVSVVVVAAIVTRFMATKTRGEEDEN